MRFGTLANLKDFPAPKSGMGFGLNHDVTTSELVTGGRAAYRSPVGYKTFNMSWAGGTENLGDFMDIFEGAYGNGPYYMLDPRSKGQNILPARWASPWMLAYVANGWGKPFVSSNGTFTYPESHDVTFTHGVGVPATKFNSPFSTTVLLEDSVNYNFRVWGVATGGAQLRATAYNQGSPQTPISLPLSSSGATSADFTAYKGGVKLSLYLPAGSTLKLQHIELMVQPEVLRTNLATNPSFEVNTAGWVAGPGVSALIKGARLMSVNGTATPLPWGNNYVTPGASPAIPGQWVAMALRLRRSGSVGLHASLTLRMRNSGSQVAESPHNFSALGSEPLADPATTKLVVFQVPAGANEVSPALWFGSMAGGGTPPASWVAHMTEVIIVTGATQAEAVANVAPYFDGSTPPSEGKAYRWTGTPNASTSQEVVSDGKQWHMGRGVGAVQFTGNIQGNLVSSKVDRIGLSVEVTEVES